MRILLKKARPLRSRLLAVITLSVENKEKKKERLSGRRPKTDNYPFRMRGEEARIAQFVWDHRHVSRAQIVETHFQSKSTADKVLAAMIRRGWLIKEKSVQRIPKIGRSVLERALNASPHLSAYFTGSPQILSIGPHGLDVLKAHGIASPWVQYSDKKPLYQAHHISVVQVWRHLADTARKHQESERHVLEWFGPFRTQMMVSDTRTGSGRNKRNDVRPDAFFSYQVGLGEDSAVEGQFFVEMDLGSEYQPGIRAKFQAYEQWEQERVNGTPTWNIYPPMSRFPYVILVAIDSRRQTQLAGYVEGLTQQGALGVRYLIVKLADLADADPIYDEIFWEVRPPIEPYAPRKWRLLDLMSEVRRSLVASL